jgi:hypothetical protein
VANKKQPGELGQVTAPPSILTTFLPAQDVPSPGTLTPTNRISVADLLKSTVDRVLDLTATPLNAVQYNAYTPPGWPATPVGWIRVATDAQGTARVLTAFAAGAYAGQRVEWQNNGPDPLKFSHNNGAGLAGKFLCPGGADLTLAVNGNCVMRWDGAFWNVWSGGGGASQAATVTNVTATNANGTYQAGAIIDITVTFTAAMTVTGAPTLALNTTPSQSAPYASGGGTPNLHFAYTVQPGDVSGDLDYAGTTALFAGGGSISDASGTPANLSLPIPGTAGSLGANKNIVIDAHLSPLLTNLVEEWACHEAANVNRVGSVQALVLTNHGSVGQADGLLGKAASFTGADTDYLSTVNTALSTGDFKWALATWFKGASQDRIILSDRPAAGPPRFQVYIHSDQTITFDVWNSTGGGPFTVTGTGWVAGQWNLVVVAFRQSTIAVSINGGPFVTASFPDVGPTGIGEFTVGRILDNAGFDFNGLVQFVTRWNRDIVYPDDVSLIYNGGVPLPYPY